MGKSRKKEQGWLYLLGGTAVSLGLYLLGILLLAWCLTQGYVGDKSVGVLLRLWAFASSCGGSLLARRAKIAGKAVVCLLQGAMFAAVLVCAGYMFWEGVTWNASAGVLLICAFAGGLLPGLLGKKSGGRRVRRK